MATFNTSEMLFDSEDIDMIDNGSNRRGQGNRGRGRGRGARQDGGRGGGGNSRGGEMNREVAVSKALSKLLRHAAEEAGLRLDQEGYARVDQVMQWPRLKSLKITFSDILTAVNNNAKQRFSMKPNPLLHELPDANSVNPSDWVIRANQGHSIAVDSASLLLPISAETGNIPEIVVHGTYYAFYEPIVKSGGLKKMGRNHIHCSMGLPDSDAGHEGGPSSGVISGMRSDAEILIYVDIKKSLDDGVKWWISDNGVVLTEGDAEGFLSSKYFKRVEGRRQSDDVGVLWEGGREVKELPVAFRDRRPPRGKGQYAVGGQGPKGRAGPSSERINP